MADRNGSNTPFLPDRCIKLAARIILPSSGKWSMGLGLNTLLQTRRNCAMGTVTGLEIGGSQFLLPALKIPEPSWLSSHHCWIIVLGAAQHLLGPQKQLKVREKEKHNGGWKNRQRKGRMARLVVDLLQEQQLWSYKYSGLSVVVTDIEYLEQKGALSSLPLEPASPLLFSLCLFEAPKWDGNTRVSITHLNFHKINVIAERPTMIH